MRTVERTSERPLPEPAQQPATGPLPGTRWSRFSGAARPRSAGARLVELAAILAFALALVFGVVRPLVVDVYAIPSASMSPTLRVGESVVVSKVAYRFGEPARGDLIVFESPAEGGATSIKRAVGLPGDRVAIRDGALVVNGRRQDEPDVDRGAIDGYFFGPVTVAPGEIFVLGDNRSNSRDSRHYGAVPEADLVGEVLLQL